MNFIKQFIALATVALAFNAAHAADEAPDALVKRISTDVLNTAKNDKAIQAGDTKKSLTWWKPRSCPTSTSSA